MFSSLEGAAQRGHNLHATLSSSADDGNWTRVHTHTHTVCPMWRRVASIMACRLACPLCHGHKRPPATLLAASQSIVVFTGQAEADVADVAAALIALCMCSTHTQVYNSFNDIDHANIIIHI